ncbi:MAG TPA: ATP-binding protein, partial [Gemmatimonadales bacterium]
TEDASGNIWMVGTGLMRIQAVPFRTLGREAGLPGGQVREVSNGPRGSVLATEAQGRLRVYQIDGDRGRNLGLDSVHVATDRRGTMWAAGLRDVRGLRAGLPDVVWPRLPTPTLVMTDDPARPGSAWFAGDRAIYHADPYAAAGPRITDSVVISGLPRRMVATSDGTLWVVTSDPDGQERLRRFDPGKEQVFSRTEGLPAVEIRAIVPDRGGAVWLGTYGAGLVRLKAGKFTAVRERDGLAEDVVSEILDDGAGNFWMAGNRSVHRVARAEVTAFLDGETPRVHGIAYGRKDGLTDPETSGDRGTRSADGRLWFPTFGGAAVVDPVLAIQLDSTPPIVHVLGMRTTSDTLLPATLTDMPLGQRRLAIDYTAISFRNPAGVRFQYRMDGVDADWIDAGDGRTAVYNDVGPGHHTFRVRAMNAGGVWSVADGTMEFSVPRYFRETAAFYLLVASLAAAVLWWMATSRVRQLRRRQAELHGLVEERTRDLGKALSTVEAQADQLRSLDEAKSRFFANVSHEFRTPLSLIMGPVEDVRAGRAGPLPEPARQRLASVMANGRRLVQLVEQLLDVARLESGTLHLNADVQDLVPLLRRISESFSSLAERRDLGFRVSCPVGGIRVRYDPDQMEKVITNLLGNALKFTPAGGKVELRARAEEEGANGWAVVEVEDTGPGISPAHQQRVFDRFYQLDDSPRRAHEGAGIGLALAKELVDLHHGTLTVRSVLGTGSTFVVRLPLASGELRDGAEGPAPSGLLEARAASAVGSASAERPARADTGPAADDVTTVLVAEDNAELLGYLREHLEDHYRVLDAANGAVALRLAREHVPDLIVSDVMMPEMDGQALCAAVKGDPEIDFIPVILLTAKASRESRLAGLEGGADDYLAKPVDMRELLVRASNLITSRRRLKERYQESRRDLPTLQVTPPHGVQSQDFVRKLYEIMAQHVGNDAFEAEAFATAMAMSRSTLYRRVEAELGRAPMDVLRDYRLEQAAQWLVSTDGNVSEIAYAVGFKSVPHFCARFRERFRRTPSAYRREQGT